jgi:RNA polymerase sigma-70 factor (ECF subfamily)
MQDEHLLLLNCQKGQRIAQRTFYEQYKRRLYGLCVRYMPSQAEAEDVLQESFVKIFKHLDTVQDVKALYPWMKRIVVRTAIDHLRSKTRFYAALEEADSLSNNDDLNILANLSAQEILAHLHLLPDGYKTVFNLYWIDGYNHIEIGEMLGISPKTSQSQLSRARALLRQMLQQDSITA